MWSNTIYLLIWNKLSLMMGSFELTDNIIVMQIRGDEFKSWNNFWHKYKINLYTINSYDWTLWKLVTLNLPYIIINNILIIE